MNKWQKIYCDTYYNGKIPRTKIGKQEFEILGKLEGSVRLMKPDEEKVFKITEDKNDIPNGLMAARSVAKNIILWLNRGYKVSTF